MDWMSTFGTKQVEDLARSLVRHTHDHPPIHDLNRDADRHLGIADRIMADLVRVIGSWTFWGIQMVVVAAWIVLNSVGGLKHWDPAPFGLLALLVAIEILLVQVLGLMTLNQLVGRDRMRAQNDYVAEIRLEEELRAIMEHLERQDQLSLEIVQRLDRIEGDLRRVRRRQSELE